MPAGLPGGLGLANIVGVCTASRVFQGCFKRVSRVFHGCFKGVS